MFQKFISFDKMITPSIIKIIFWLGVAISIISGLIIIIGGIASPYGGGGEVISGLLFIIFGPLMTRVYCELLILLFKIHDNLCEIKDKLNENDN